MSLEVLTQGGSSKNVSAIVITGLKSTDTVTCVSGGKSYGATWDATNGRWEILKLPLGTFTVTATRGSLTATETVLIDIAGVYSIKMSIDYYGDGSLNTVQNGYNGKLLLNGEEWNPDTKNYSKGNLNASIYAVRDRLVDAGAYSEGSVTNISVGNNSRTVNWTASESDLSIVLVIRGGNHGFNSTPTLSNLKFTCDGSAQTFSQLVASGAIKPIVLILHSGDTNNYLWPTPLSMYSGGSSGAASGNYPAISFNFVLNAGHSISSLSFNSTAALSSYNPDGVAFWTIDAEDFLISMREEAE